MNFLAALKFFFQPSHSNVQFFFLFWVLPREPTGHSKHPLPTTTQEKTLHTDITRWSILKSDWLYSLQPNMEKLYTVSKAKTRNWLLLSSWLFIAKFRLKLKKVETTTGPFGYDLNQIPYNYTVVVTNRFKGLSDRQSAWRIMDGGSWHCTGGSD